MPDMDPSVPRPMGDPPRPLVVGGGSWGTALALHLSEKGHPVVQWIRDPILASDIRATRENRVYLPGMTYPATLSVTDSLEEGLSGATVVVLAVPCQAVRPVATQLRTLMKAPLPLISGTKGIERGTHALVSSIIRDVYSEDPDRYAILSGPSFAKEVAKHLPTAVVIASSSERLAREGQALFNAPTFKVYTRHDVIGIEVGGAMKNVIALAAGISDGMELGANSRAALLTRGLAEMTRLGVRLGADKGTFSGLGGVGDLFLTATSELSRNRRVGVQLGRGESLLETLKEVGQVAEGVPTAQSAYEFSGDLGIDLPITRAVFRILYEGAGLSDTLRSLMSRPSKAEEDEA